MINQSDLRDMSAADRRELARTLAAFDCPDPMLGLYISRRRRVGILFSLIACVALAAWIIVLALTLHRSFHTHYWRGAWVGFDIFEFLGFAATGWALWRGRQIAIAFLLITGTLLCCDAWFDVFLDLGTRNIWESVGSALFAELPLAFIAFTAARRLLRMSVGVVMQLEGITADVPPLWKIPLFAEGLSAALPARYRNEARDAPPQEAARAE